MSNIIKLLPDSVANQIAAGEVIQRPASAAKELLENAVDSGATQITLAIKDAGKTLIQVTDNGCGMSAIDSRMCFERHATSKISKADDLFAIKTMGFRGEAMASIAAISQVELKSKPVGDDVGTCVKIEGSKVISQEPCQCSEGTSISVKSLFYNVPARRNFLKSNTVELRHIIEEFTRISTVNNNIGFSYYNNDKLVFKLMPGSMKSRIVSLFGNVYNERLLTVKQKTETVNISGFIGKPEFAKKTRGEQYFFVNNRFIKHPYLHHAVNNAYTELIPVDSFPSYFINIEIDPKYIDINIHPTKTEVNFQDARYVYAILQSAVKQTIGKHALTPTLDFDVIPDIEAAFQTKPSADLKQPSINLDPEYNPFTKQKSDFAGDATSFKKPSVKNWEALYDKHGEQDSTKSGNQEIMNKAVDPESEFESNKFLQVHNKFIVCNVKSGMMLIDQHLAHERIIYEDILDKLKSNSQPSQQQLFPQEIHMSPGDAEIVKSLKTELVKIGFGLEELGTNSFVIVGIPTDIKESSVTGIIEKIIENHKANLSDLNYDKNINLARSMASNLAIKPGTKLDEKEMQEIFDSLFMCNVPRVSPDGKKTLTIVDIGKLEELIKSNK
ncbi:MAG: DNA mismatch repair endonuclease MutL [Bacteroidetes bacterium]|nr:DNA mismatch repair endonuclease MutL [Bacteroidota bacterium]MBL6943661.1 DNA mismatch repair endonuclease MutL [Bacteroidales bacterium]